jgi:hypothetical protein
VGMSSDKVLSLFWKDAIMRLIFIKYFIGMWVISAMSMFLWASALLLHSSLIAPVIVLLSMALFRYQNKDICQKFRSEVIGQAEVRPLYYAGEVSCVAWSLVLISGLGWDAFRSAAPIQQQGQITTLFLWCWFLPTVALLYSTAVVTRTASECRNKT